MHEEAAAVEIAALKAKVESLSSQMLEMETLYTAKRCQKSIEESIRDFVLTLGYRHAPRHNQIKIVMDQTLIEIFNEEREECKNKGTKIVWDNHKNILERVTTDMKPNIMEHLGIEVELVPIGERAGTY